MTKRMQKVGTVALGGLLLAAVIALAAFSAVQCAAVNTKESADGDDPDAPPETAAGKDTYPEPATALRSLAYPFADDESYAYFYANIHDYLGTMPEWDGLISYKSMLPASTPGSQPFDVRQDLLYQNVRGWIASAVYMHPYFKSIPGQMTLAVDYRVAVPERAILINATWSFPDDDSVERRLPKVYWDQFRATVADPI